MEDRYDRSYTLHTPHMKKAQQDVGLFLLSKIEFNSLIYITLFEVLSQNF